MNDKAPSPIKKPSRAIRPDTTMFLYVQAGGHCEFEGCPKYLLEHYPTEVVGNFAEQAHIYAFSEKGPRGDEPGRPDDVNRLDNLILLCPECHHLIDQVAPGDYSVETLKRFKKDHEDRIFGLTSLARDRDIVPLVVRARIRGRAMDVSQEEMQAAVRPFCLKRRAGISIDLGALPDAPVDSYWQQGVAAIDARIDELERLERLPGRARRIAVFGLAPIPLLVHLGSRLSDKSEVQLFQRHRAPESWEWKDGEGRAHFITRRLASPARSNAVSLLVNLSGRNGVETLPSDCATGTVYETTLDGVDPTPLFLDTRADLDRFTDAYIRATAVIRHSHPGLRELHVFPAVPAPVAITIGRSRLSKVDPALVVYDLDSRAGGFVRTLEIP